MKCLFAAFVKKIKNKWLITNEKEIQEDSFILGGKNNDDSERSK